MIVIAYGRKDVNNEVALKKNSIEATAKCEFLFEKKFTVF